MHKSQISGYSIVYTFGFNGMEKTNEVYGNGNEYTSMFRQYDPRIGRWMSVDPKFYLTSYLSPYMSMDGNPIFYKDPLGDKVIVTKDESISKKELNEMKRNIRMMRKSSESFNKMYKEMDADKNRTYTFNFTAGGTGGATIEGDDGNGVTNFAISTASFSDQITTIAHEFGHQYRSFSGLDPEFPHIPTDMVFGRTWTEDVKSYVTTHVKMKRQEEFSACHVSNIVISELHRSGKKYFESVSFETKYYGMEIVLVKKDDLFRNTYTINKAMMTVVLPDEKLDYYKNTQFNIHDEIKKVFWEPPFKYTKYN